MIDLRMRQRPREAGVIKANCLGGQRNPTNEFRVEQDRLDAERERRIDELGFRLRSATHPDVRRDIWTRLKGEIGARSTQQIRRMEVERGLAPELDAQPNPKISVAEHSGRDDSWREPKLEC